MKKERLFQLVPRPRVLNRSSTVRKYLRACEAAIDTPEFRKQLAKRTQELLVYGSSPRKKRRHTPLSPKARKTKAMWDKVADLCYP
jgi:hypothetical protein